MSRKVHGRVAVVGRAVWRLQPRRVSMRDVFIGCECGDGMHHLVFVWQVVAFNS